MDLELNGKKNGNKIFDAGTAEGSVITKARKYFPDDVTIVGCDNDEKMVELGNQRYSDEKTSFIVLDIARDLPDDMKGSYSHVISFYCLNWVKDQVSAVKNIYNLLEPNGECYMLIVTYSPIFEVYRRLTRNANWKPWVYDVERYISTYCDSQDPEGEIKILMANAGFENITLGLDHTFYTYKDMEAMRGSLMALCPFKIPTDKRDEFWEDYVQELRAIKGCDNGVKNILYNFKILTAHAQKPKETKT